MIDISDSDEEGASKNVKVKAESSKGRRRAGPHEQGESFEDRSIDYHFSNRFDSIEERIAGGDVLADYQKQASPAMAETTLAALAGASSLHVVSKRSKRK